MQVNAVDVSTEAAEPMIVVEYYRRTHDGTVKTKYARDLGPNDRPGMPSHLK